MSNDTRPSIDQAVDAIEKLTQDAFRSNFVGFNSWWNTSSAGSKAEAILREYAQKENGALMEQIEHLTAEKSELVMNLEACEKERLEAVRKVVERDGLIMRQKTEIDISREFLVSLNNYIKSIRGKDIKWDKEAYAKLQEIEEKYITILEPQIP